MFFQGIQYSGMTEMAYIPGTPYGRKVCQMMKRAFDMRKIFNIVVDKPGVGHLCWAKFPHKTNIDGGPER